MHADKEKMRSIRCVVFGGYGTDMRQLTKKTRSIFDPSIPNLTHALFPLQVADLFSRRGHERIHGMSSQYDIVHYTSASSFCLGTKCALDNKTIILDGVPYLRNDESLVRACFPKALHHPRVEKVMRLTLDLMKFDDDWYAQYVSRIVHLGVSNRVYVIHSQRDAISTFADALPIIHQMVHAKRCILENATHHAYHKHPEYATFIRSAIMAHRDDEVVPGALDGRS
jgi:hypothetical protein